MKPSTKQEDIIITFEEYLTKHLKMSIDDYDVLIDRLKVNKLHSFPSLFKPKLKTTDDVATEVELLNQTNNIYGILFKYLVFNRKKTDTSTTSLKKENNNNDNE